MKTLKSKLRTTILATALALGYLSAQAQPFTEMTALSDSLIGVKEAAATWADYDGDGDLDIFLIGSATDHWFTANLYRNDAGTFMPTASALPGLNAPTIDWGDYDNDGDLDILVAGTDANQASGVSKVFQNTNGTFTDINAGLSGMADGDAQWGDFDADGDLDILLAGYQRNMTLYRNDAGTFTDIGATLGIAENSAFEWGDYDNDGDLDILVAGYDGAPFSRVFRNDTGAFTSINAGLTGLLGGSAAWADYDQDGDLDILITGVPNSNDTILSLLYRNDASTFTEVPASLPGVYLGGIDWGDYDQDGDLDLLLAGNQLNTPITKLMRNDGGTFVDANAGLATIGLATAKWGDYDNDGDLDILLTGAEGNIPTAKIYRNDRSTAAFAPNTPPTALAGLTATQQGSSEIHFTWHPTTDAQTPTEALSYRLWIGSASNNYDISAPMADTATGWRRIVARGDLQDTTWTLSNVSLGNTYFACVSAIDAGFMGSPCSNQVSVMIVGLREKPEYATLLITASPNPTPDRITIRAHSSAPQPMRYTLLQANGQPLPQHQGSFQSQIQLDLSDLPTGLYLLQVESPDLTQPAILKIIKQ